MAQERDPLDSAPIIETSQQLRAQAKEVIASARATVAHARDLMRRFQGPVAVRSGTVTRRVWPDQDTN